jgi:hypothetical protein
MPITMKELVTNDTIAGSTAGTVDTLYTATGVRAHITAFTVANVSASPVTLTVYILASGVAATAAGPVAVQSIPALGTAIVSDVLGHIVPTGGTIKAFTSTGSTVVVSNVSGFEIT